MDMSVKFIFFTFLTCFAIKEVTPVRADPQDSQPNIIGGEFAQLGEIPYQVGIFAGEYKHRKNYLEDFQIEENFLFCGGTIISKRHVLSAASCFVNTCDGYIGGQECFIKKHLYVKAGIIDKLDNHQNRSVKSVVKYEDYGTKSILSLINSYDIALLTVEPFTFDDRVKAVHLAMELPPRGTNCIVSGWGPYEHPEVSSKFLKKAKYGMGSQIPFTDKIVFPPNNLKTGITKTVDAGGPLVCDGKLTAIISNHRITIPLIFSKPLVIDVLTSVVSHLDWLQEKGVQIGGAYE